jgi:hypothetical protein
MKRAISVVAALAAIGLFSAWAARAQQRAASDTGDGPRYSNGTDLIRPANYREWVFLSSSLGLTYEPSGSASNRPPTFGNVFVNPSSYRSFMQTGKWPDKTIFVLEFRQSESAASINKNGRFQTTLAVVEAEVKDSRSPDGWAFFNFGSGPPGPAGVGVPPLSGERAAPCVECHTQHTAVERTFVQFYPTLFEVAKRLGTVKPDYTDP